MRREQYLIDYIVIVDGFHGIIAPTASLDSLFLKHKKMWVVYL